MTLKQSIFMDIASIGVTKGQGDYCLVVRNVVNPSHAPYATCRLERDGKVLRSFEESTIDLRDGASLSFYKKAFEEALGFPLRLELVASFAALEVARVQERLERAWDAGGPSLRTRGTVEGRGCGHW